MIFLWICFGCILWAGTAIYFNWKRVAGNTYEGGIGSAIVIFVVFLLISGVSILVSRYSHYDDFQLYYQAEADIEILQERKTNLTAKFSGLLDSKYLEHEAELFQEMSNEDVEMLFTKYPELKANTTLMNLVDKIFRLNDDVYNKQLYMNIIRKDIQMRYKNPAVLPFFLPDVPTDIKLVQK